MASTASTSATDWAQLEQQCIDGMQQAQAGEADAVRELEACKALLAKVCSKASSAHAGEAWSIPCQLSSSLLRHALLIDKAVAPGTSALLRLVSSMSYGELLMHVCEC